MVPSVVVVVDALPLTVNGKVDRRALPALPTAADTVTVHSRGPLTPAEEALCALCAEILGRQSVGTNDNFFDIGGDSISFIRLVSRARGIGLVLNVRDVFHHQTVAALAAAARTLEDADVPGQTDDPTGPVPPTQIMQWLRELGGPIDAFNQSVLVRLPATVDEASLTAALVAVVSHHDALRARLTPQWCLEIPGPGTTQAETLLQRVDVAGFDDRALNEAVVAAGQRAVSRLKPATGSMFQAVWFDAGTGQSGHLLLVVHHLVVDAVSWRVLIPDLAAACEAVAAGTTPTLAAVPNSFARWAHRVNDMANSPDRRDELAGWIGILNRPDPPLGTGPLVPDLDTFGTVQRLRTAISNDYSAEVFDRVCLAFHARIEEVLVTALALAVHEWRRHRGQPRDGGILVDMESHGRAVEGVDLSRTVGWFTNIYPVRLDVRAPAGTTRGRGVPADVALKRVKEQLRAVPDHGAGFGVLRYLNDDTAQQLRTLASPQIGFNYLGRVVDEPDVWTSVGDWTRPPQAHPDMPLPHLLELTVLCRGEGDGATLAAVWSWAGRLLAKEEVEELATLWTEALVSLARSVQQQQRGGRTPSDLPMVSLTQEELDALEEEWEG
jgi:non-ribosomal peptide synthase protein (TIGR01720 family)